MVFRSGKNLTQPEDIPSKMIKEIQIHKLKKGISKIAYF
jgi:hypothetical protein